MNMELIGIWQLACAMVVLIAATARDGIAEAKSVGASEEVPGAERAAQPIRRQALIEEKP
jgi:hypothetical protein